MELPTRVRIAGEYYRPVVMRIESRREHDNLPDTLTALTDEDMVELSEDEDKNQFVIVYAKIGSFTPQEAKSC